MKLLITSHGRFGKDTTCEYLRDHYGLSFISSSEHVGKRIIYPLLKKSDESLTWEQCFKERHQNRSLWYNLITEYNTPDKARVGKEIFSTYDIYCGLRNIDEFNAQKKLGLFDHSIWIDASLRLPPESSSSITIKDIDCDHIIENNRGIEELYSNIDKLMEELKIVKTR